MTCQQTERSTFFIKKEYIYVVNRTFCISFASKVWSIRMSVRPITRVEHLAFPRTQIHIIKKAEFAVVKKLKNDTKAKTSGDFANIYDQFSNTEIFSPDYPSL